MSIRRKPGLDGRGILVHLCSQCHSPRLDQTLTRARFNVMALDAMSREERDTAIAWLGLSADWRLDPQLAVPRDDIPCTWLESSRAWCRRSGWYTFQINTWGESRQVTVQPVRCGPVTADHDGRDVMT
jgi:hypothetical protein